MTINDPLSQSELARKLNLPGPRLAAILREHGIVPDIRRQNLALYSSETVDVVRQLLATPTPANVALVPEILA